MDDDCAFDNGEHDAVNVEGPAIDYDECGATKDEDRIDNDGDLHEDKTSVEDGHRSAGDTDVDNSCDGILARMLPVRSFIRTYKNFVPFTVSVMVMRHVESTKLCPRHPESHWCDLKNLFIYCEITQI